MIKFTDYYEKMDGLRHMLDNACYYTEEQWQEKEKIDMARYKMFTDIYNESLYPEEIEWSEDEEEASKQYYEIEALLEKIDRKLKTYASKIGADDYENF